MTRSLTGVCLLVLLATAAPARGPGDPIRLEWTEGDVAGFTQIHAVKGGAIGRIAFHQRRRDNLLESVRVARFADGSSDEDYAVARVGTVLEAVRGRSIVRDPGGRVVVDLHIDITKGRLHGFYVDDGERIDFDEATSLSPASYWGPLVFLVVKNFDANAEDGRVRFQTIVPTPKPRVLPMEVVESGPSTLARPEGAVGVERYTLRPLVNPLLQLVLPEIEFFVEPGTPPALVRYEGPRNYAGQEIRLE